MPTLMYAAGGLIIDNGPAQNKPDPNRLAKRQATMAANKLAAERKSNGAE